MFFPIWVREREREREREKERYPLAFDENAYKLRYCAALQSGLRLLAFWPIQLPPDETLQVIIKRNKTSASEHAHFFFFIITAIYT